MLLLLLVFFLRISALRTSRVDFQALKQQLLAVEGATDATTTLPVAPDGDDILLPERSKREDSTNQGTFLLDQNRRDDTLANASLIQFKNASVQIQAASRSGSSLGVQEVGTTVASNRSSFGKILESELNTLAQHVRFLALLNVTSFGGSVGVIIALTTLSLICCALTYIAYKLWLALVKARISHALLAKQSREEDSASVSECSDFEWCSHQALSHLMQSSKCFDLHPIGPTWTAESILVVFKEFGMDGSHWMEQHLTDFACDLTSGKTMLAKEGDALVQVIDFVLVFLVYEPDNLVMQEPAYRRSWNIDASSAAYDAWDTAFKSRLRSSEGLLSGAERCLKEKLQISIEGKIIISPDIINAKEKRESADCSVLRLGSITRLFVVEAKVITTSQLDLETLGISAKTFTSPGCTYTWECIDALPHVQKHLRPQLPKSNRCQGSRWKGLSYSYTPVLPWSESEILRVLRKHGNEDCDQFGKTLQELSAAMSSGSVTLFVQKARGGKLVCVSEKVAIVVESQNSQILVTEKVTGCTSRPALPTTTKFGSESIWNAALRVSQTSLNLSVPIFQMDGLVLAVVDTTEAGREDCIVREFLVRGPKFPG